MHAKTVLQTCLAPALEQIHARRAHALLGAVTALIMGRRLVLMDLARSWPGAERVRAPLKCLDRCSAIARCIWDDACFTR